MQCGPEEKPAAPESRNSNSKTTTLSQGRLKGAQLDRLIEKAVSSTSTI